MDTPYLIASSAIDDTAICNDVSTVAQWHILRPMEDGKTPLAKVLIRRIDEAVGGNQAAYARLVGITPTHLNQMVKGKISLPGKEHRKALANDLGIRVIDFFGCPNAAHSSPKTRSAAQFRAANPRTKRNPQCLAGGLLMGAEGEIWQWVRFCRSEPPSLVPILPYRPY